LSKITTRMKRHVRHVLKDENPTIWVGKDGLTPQSLGEIEKQLQKNKKGHSPGIWEISLKLLFRLLLNADLAEDRE